MREAGGVQNAFRQFLRSALLTGAWRRARSGRANVRWRGDEEATTVSATPESAPATPATTSAAAAVAQPVNVHFSTAEPGVTVYARPVTPERLTGTDAAHEGPAFQAICQAPCDAKLEPALHEFAVAPAGSEPIPVRRHSSSGATRAFAPT